MTPFLRFLKYKFLNMNLGGTVKFNRSAFIIILISLTGLYMLYSWSRGNEKSISNDVIVSKVSLSELLCAAIAVAEAGGKEVRTVRAATKDLTEKIKGKTKEGVKDVATDGDMRSHHIMFDTISAAFPHVQVISEEHDEANIPPKLIKLDSNCEALKHISKNEWVLSDSVTIWIDPLDATKEYTENLLEFVTTMVCVAVNGKPVIGVIHKPFEDKTFWGWVGHEVSEDLHSNMSTDEADNESFIISRSHTGDTVEKLIASKFPNSKITTAGGAGYKALEVAIRRQGAYIHNTHIKKWDVCAGHAVLMALGGHIRTLKNAEIMYGPNDSKLIEDGLLGTLKNSDLYNSFFN